MNLRSQLKVRMAYKNVLKRVKRLLSLQLIERVEVNKSKHGAKYYKLTQHGIFQIVAMQGYLQIDTEKLHLFLFNHSDDLLFETFLFKYFEQQTIMGLSGLNLKHLVFEYLHKCCIDILTTLDSLNEKETIVDRVYSVSRHKASSNYPVLWWDTFCSNETDIHLLLSFLTRIGVLHFHPAEITVEQTEKQKMIMLEDDDQDMHIQLSLNVANRTVMFTIDDKKNKSKKYGNLGFEDGWIMLPREIVNSILLDERVNNRLENLIFNLTMHQTDLGALLKIEDL